EIHPVMKLTIGSAAPGPPAVPAPTVQFSFPTPASIAPTPATIPQPTSSAATEQFVTITKPVAIQIPHGSTVLQPGTRLPILSRDSNSVDVRYLDSRYTIPISSTDLR